MTVRYENQTNQGNVKAFRAEVTESPFSHAGKAHAALICELRNGKEMTQDGHYFPTIEEANARAAEYDVMAAKAGLVKVS
jgi:hypothetical protein